MMYARRERKEDGVERGGVPASEKGRDVEAEQRKSECRSSCQKMDDNRVVAADTFLK